MMAINIVEILFCKCKNYVGVLMVVYSVELLDLFLQ